MRKAKSINIEVRSDWIEPKTSLDISIGDKIKENSSDNVKNYEKCDRSVGAVSQAIDVSHQIDQIKLDDLKEDNKNGFSQSKEGEKKESENQSEK